MNNTPIRISDGAAAVWLCVFCLCAIWVGCQTAIMKGDGSRKPCFVLIVLGILGIAATVYWRSQ